MLMHAMKVYAVMEVKLHSFLTLTLDRVSKTPVSATQEEAGWATALVQTLWKM